MYKDEIEWEATCKIDLDDLITSYEEEVIEILYEKYSRTEMGLIGRLAQTCDIKVGEELNGNSIVNLMEDKTTEQRLAIVRNYFKHFPKDLLTLFRMD